MNTAIAFSGGPQRITKVPAKAAPIRLLPTAHTPEALPRHVRAHTPPNRIREGVLLTALALAVHALIVWAVWNRTETPRIHKAAQEIELLRLPPAVEPEPLKPVPPPLRKVEPHKAIEPPKPSTPQPAARTPAAEALQANTLTVPENVSDAKTTGPVIAAAPSPAPVPKLEEPITEPNGAAAYLNNPPPAYPKAAQRLGLQGRVVLRVQVLANGQVGTLEVKQSSGKPVLDEAALSAVKAWIFTPSKRGNTPIDGWTNVPIEFKLAG
jgi:protein TonB